MRSALQRGLLVPAVDALCRPRISGAHLLEACERGFIVVANHTSHLDCPVLLRALPPPIRGRTVVAAAADYFYRNPLIGATLGMVLGTISFERHGDPAASLARCCELLGSGHVLLIFPEGTRSRDGIMGRFRHGAARLALWSGVPIAPACVIGLRQVLPPGARVPRPHQVTVRFETPLFARPGDDAHALTRRVEDAVTQLLATPSRRPLEAA